MCYLLPALEPQNGNFLGVVCVERMLCLEGRTSGMLLGWMSWREVEVYVQQVLRHLVVVYSVEAFDWRFRGQCVGLDIRSCVSSMDLY